VDAARPQDWSGFLKRLPAQIERYRAGVLQPICIASTSNSSTPNGNCRPGESVDCVTRQRLGRSHDTLMDRSRIWRRKWYVRTRAQLGTVIRAPRSLMTDCPLAAARTYESIPMRC